MDQFEIGIDQEKQIFSLKINGILLINHSAKTPCIELSHNIADFKMHPRSVSNYKLKNKIINRFPLSSFTVLEKTAEGVILDFNEILRLLIRKNKDLVEFSIEKLPKFNQKASKFNRFTLFINADPNEAIYGCGEQFSYLNLRGRSVPMWTQEPGFAKNHSIYKFFGDLLMGAGGEWWTNYYPHPIFVSSLNYFINIESYAFAEFDFRNKYQHKLNLNEIPEKIFLGAEKNTPKLLTTMTEYLGRQRPLPAWILDGAILGIGDGLDKENPHSVVN